jgi:excinuclease ABC subunit C
MPDSDKTDFISSKVALGKDQKEFLENLSNNKLYLRNSFANNQKEIAQLLDQGRQNAMIYLQRNQLGQKLSIFEENNLFTSIVELQKKLSLPILPRHIECYDISHLSGTFVYGSMVTFIDGRPAKKLYKLFKCKEQNNDFENHKQVLRRRLKRAFDWELEQAKNNQDQLKSKTNPWKLPDLIIVDGGKGQLSGDYEVLQEFESIFKANQLRFEVYMCALAKKEEEIFSPNFSDPVLTQGATRFLIQRIRDEAHRFAITNNQNARLKTATKSKLDEVKGIGQVTKQKILKTFGSTENMVESLFKNQELIYELVGKSITEKLKKHFGVI